MKLNKIMMMAFGAGVLASSAANAKSFERAYNDISEKSLHQHIKTISSDEFEGRLPTSKGEKLVLDYLTKQFKKAGWQPGNNGSFLQPVELSEITASPEMSLSVAGNGQSAEFKYERDMVLGTSRVSKFEQIKDSEIVFVGYGINAPEYKWNDYEGLDVKGKTVVMLVNDPGYASQIPSLFTGSAMTYYGRWTYKYEEASRQGAAAAIIVHETAPASYPWSVVTNGWTGPQYVLFDKDGNKDRVQIEGWLTLDATRDLFKQAGLDFTTYKNKAMQGPINKSLGLTASATVKSTIKNSTSHNFVATLPGSKRPTEQILLTGHWDHIGTSEETEGDTIYNGAHDNATGISGIIEIAKALASLDQRPERSITVVATTAEEQGLLGSKYYAENPIYALADTVGVLNIDSMNILGPVKDLEVRGLGKSELEKYLKTAALKQKRNLVKESNPAAGSYYRSDHFNFAKVGVPALYAGGGSEPLNSDVAAYRKKILPKMRACYHQTCDEYNPEWDLNGAVDDAKVHFDIIYQLANSQDWPQWSATSEFQRQQPVNKQ
ncbi:M20/M25/M40 family metallo-hydrolase [Thalassotalea sp. HSM 43]|uniref:M28 family metallopeptidase n=1 Tax=Thalassotalea sp. HSM 43 TaxID=2552945 RepID=UPI0010815C8A|nr:M28 family metallopeptidase [Thalassotalea sp. HSM 43]QBY05830.1 M20/M25/M40 family metallo-hydrolase [Thalassotalea sp. HSM 43]